MNCNLLEAQNSRHAAFLHDEEWQDGEIEEVKEYDGKGDSDTTQSTHTHTETYVEYFELVPGTQLIVVEYRAQSLGRNVHEVLTDGDLGEPVKDEL